MSTGFDNSALTYDQTFTYTNIGKYLRKRIHKYLDQSLPANKKLNILELNCGTGEDAIYFGKKGHTVIASDSSIQMLETAKKKANNLKPNLDIRFEHLDINNIKSFLFTDKYDLVFSNFGGLNCIPVFGLKELGRNIKHLLVDNGRFIAVVMSKYCLWEIAYYLLKRKPGKSFRRSKYESLDVNVNGNIVETFYYTPSELEKVFMQEFKLYKKFPVGLFLPPTYMEYYFKNRTGFLSLLNRLESFFGRSGFLSVLGDHFLLDFKVK